jgi:hypothetical protein
MEESADPRGTDESTDESTDSVCDFCGLEGEFEPRAEYYRVRTPDGESRLTCDECLERFGPFAEYEVFLDEVPWVSRTVDRLVPGVLWKPEVHFRDASARVSLRFLSPDSDGGYASAAPSADEEAPLTSAGWCDAAIVRGPARGSRPMASEARGRVPATDWLAAPS